MDSSVWHLGGVSSVGETVKTLRAERNWGILDLAAASGVDKEQISKIENGEVKPQARTLKKLADAFKVPIAALGTTAQQQERKKAAPSNAAGVDLTDHSKGGRSSGRAGAKGAGKEGGRMGMTVEEMARRRLRPKQFQEWWDRSSALIKEIADGQEGPHSSRRRKTGG